jgi:hypothetical protein
MAQRDLSHKNSTAHARSAAAAAAARTPRARYALQARFILSALREQSSCCRKSGVILKRVEVGSARFLDPQVTESKKTLSSFALVSMYVARYRCIFMSVSSRNNSCRCVLKRSTSIQYPVPADSAIVHRAKIVVSLCHYSTSVVST